MPAPIQSQESEDFYDLVARLTALYEQALGSSKAPQTLSLASEEHFPGPADSEQAGEQSDAESAAEELQVQGTRSQISAQSSLSLHQLWTQEFRPKSRRLSPVGMSLPRLKSVNSVGSFSSGIEDPQLSQLREGLRSGDVIKERSCIQKFMVNPNSWASVIWDAVSVMFVFYDLITLPLQVFSFTSSFLSAGDLLVAVVWTLDILMSFLRGVTDRGAVDMRPTYVAKKYVGSWFFVDLSVVATDWVLLLSNGLDDMEVLRVLRGRIFLRLLRVLRLIRVIKVADRSSIIRLKEAVLNDHNKAVSSVLQLLFLVILINHYVGSLLTGLLRGRIRASF
ncbi:unnamed protein product [Effrenium voratum]|uniref:Ion transport domain-containing protein n=1 Tax=Effrenium voratum TaxID=2562239 RepID=A0AA36J857_9DINO|nr:unnamed protein product [Effrenium voratum]